MAHGPVNSAWRVCISAAVGLVRISQADYDVLRQEYEDVPITIDRDGAKVTKCLHLETITADTLQAAGYVLQGRRSYYRERNVTAREYDE